MSDFGVGAIANERARQIRKGYTIEHDLAEHEVSDLLRAAACLLDQAASELEDMDFDFPHPFWPENMGENKRYTSSGETAIVAAAFVAAAVDMIAAEEGLS